MSGRSENVEDALSETKNEARWFRLHETGTNIEAIWQVKHLLVL